MSTYTATVRWQHRAGDGGSLQCHCNANNFALSWNVKEEAMRSARVTVLMKPEEKADLEAKAAKRGVSSGEYIRLAVDNFEEVSPAEEAELAALVAEANIAIPKMAESLERTCEKLEAIHKETDEFLRRMGIRK